MRSIPTSDSSNGFAPPAHYSRGSTKPSGRQIPPTHLESMIDPRRILLLVGSLVLLAACAESLHAQADVLLRLRSGDPPADRLRADSAGGFVAMGGLGYGNIPASGSGVRMMWHPSKAAFRAGGISSGGTQWDDAAIGSYSAALGFDTRASGMFAFAAGDRSVARGLGAVAMGSGVEASGRGATAIGLDSWAGGESSFAAGFGANATGSGSISIGYRTTADGDYSVALGYRASANGRQGSFTWADASTTDSLEASANNRFSIRAAGGVLLYTNATTTTGVYLTAGGSSWYVVSDRNRKTDFEPLDGEQVLMRLRQVPVTRWRYIDEADAEVRHIGPMAQDWRAAFQLGGDGTTINMSDMDGVSIAAIRALEIRTEELRRDNEALRAQLRTARDEYEKLRERIDRIEASLAEAETR